MCVQDEVFHSYKDMEMCKRTFPSCINNIESNQNNLFSGQLHVHVCKSSQLMLSIETFFSFLIRVNIGNIVKYETIFKLVLPTFSNFHFMVTSLY